MRYELGQETVWVKCANTGNPSSHYRLLKALAVIMRAPVLQPVPNPGGAQTIATEVRRLQDLQARGLRVPVVLAQETDGFLMRHLGEPGAPTPSLSDELETAARNAPASTLGLWKQGLDAMQLVHERGTCLSQAFARNMVRGPDGVVGYIDFEDDPLATLPRELCIVKDALCYAQSTALFMQTAGQLDAARELWQAWEAQSSPAVQAALTHTVGKMRWLGKLPNNRKLGRDTLRLRAMHKMLYKI